MIAHQIAKGLFFPDFLPYHGSGNATDWDGVPVSSVSDEPASVRALSLLRGLLAHHGGPAAAWLEEQEAALPEPGTPAFARLFARSARLFKGPLRLQAGAAAALKGIGIPAPAEWTGADLLRAALLLGAFPDPHETDPVRVEAVFRTSDTAERVALMRALILLPGPARFAPLAAEACRTSVQPVFEAVACGNAFPARCFDDGAFNRMVLKAVFTGAPVARIHGLAERMNLALRRMAADARAEREAAGRPVPPDLIVLLEPESVTP